MIAFSFANLAASASLVVGASTTFTDTVHPATNVQLFGRPNLRAYSADTSAQRLTFDFGSTTALGVIALVHPNFLTVTIQGNGSDTWGAPSYTSGLLTMGYAGNDHVHHAHRPTVVVPFSQRYLSILVPTQGTTDGATVFKLGPVWAGALIEPTYPDVLTDPDEDKVPAVLDPKTEDGRTMPRLILDDASWKVTAKRIAYGATPAAHEAALAQWRLIDRLWDAAPGQAALVLWRNSYPAEAYVSRRTTSKWRHGRVLSESDLETLEVVRG